MTNNNGSPPVSLSLEQAVKMYLIGAVQFGEIVIRYQHGKPTHVERRETFRLAPGGEEPKPA